jgi:hypothetical protein
MSGWPRCLHCGDGYEPRPAGSAPELDGTCRSCTRMCRGCGKLFTTTPAERAIQAEAIRRHAKRVKAGKLGAIPDTLPRKCPDCRPAEKFPRPTASVVRLTAKGGRCYRRIQLGVGHPFANSGGWQYVHRFIAMQKLGRRLSREEHCHHRRGDLVNGRKIDEPENIEVQAAIRHNRVSAIAAFCSGKLRRDERGKFCSAPDAAPLRPLDPAILDDTPEPIAL